MNYLYTLAIPPITVHTAAMHPASPLVIPEKKPRITLLLTAYPVRDLGQIAQHMKLTAMLLKGAAIIAELYGPIETKSESFTLSAIKWAESQIAKDGLGIDLVCGDQASRLVVETLGLKYFPELRLEEPAR